MARCLSVYIREVLVSVLVVGSSVNIGSFACSCRRIFCRSGDLTRHQRFCGGQPPQSAQQIFNCACVCACMVCTYNYIT